MIERLDHNPIARVQARLLEHGHRDRHLVHLRRTTTAERTGPRPLPGGVTESWARAAREALRNCCGTCLRRGYVGIEVSGIRPIWWLRAVVVTVVIVYFELPYSVSGWIPVWLPFLLAVVTEAQFFLSGWRSTPRRERVDPGPQVSDLEELGRGSLLNVPLRQGGELWLESGEFTEPEVAEWLRRNEEQLAALPAGRFAAGPLRLDSDNEIRAVTEAPAPPAVAPRRSRLGVLVSVLIVVGVGVLLFTRSSGWQQLSRQTRAAAEAQFSRLAAEIAGHRVTVSCDNRHVGYVQGDDGLAQVGGRQAWLTTDICLALVQLRDGKLDPHGESASHAVVVLAHESWHLRGVASESLANCFAYQSGVGVAEKLGVSPSTAEAMMREQLAENGAVYADDPAYLIPSGCSDGGKYDLHPNSSRFP